MNKKDELEKRTVAILEKTKKDIKKYENERKTLFEYWEEKKDLEEWEKFLSHFEEII